MGIPLVWLTLAKLPITKEFVLSLNLYISRSSFFVFLFHFFKNQLPIAYKREAILDEWSSKILIIAYGCKSLWITVLSSITVNGFRRKPLNLVLPAFFSWDIIPLFPVAKITGISGRSSLIFFAITSPVM